jgi:hypothetical protein
MFSQAVIEKLAYYVYFLVDPRTNSVFYVGKGRGNRVWDHLECAVDTNETSQKLEMIREILTSGFEVKHYILRHGLTEKVAFDIEAALIDFVGMDNLLNLQAGHYSDDFGLKTASEIISLYEAQPLSTEVPVVLININRRYKRDMTCQDLYNATRQSWVVGQRRERAKYAVAIYRGITREVYKIEKWFSIQVNRKTRWGFNGSLAEEDVRAVLCHKSVSSLFLKGAANPIKYLNC